MNIGLSQVTEYREDSKGKDCLLGRCLVRFQRTNQKCKHGQTVTTKETHLTKRNLEEFGKKLGQNLKYSGTVIVFEDWNQDNDCQPITKVCKYKQERNGTVTEFYTVGDYFEE